MYKKDYIEDTTFIKPVSPQKGKPVLQLDMSGEILNEYISISEAKKATGLSSISAACRGINRHAGGFFWVYKERYQTFVSEIMPTIFEKRIPKERGKEKGGKVVQLDTSGNLIKIWNSVKEIEDGLGINKMNIYACCLGTRKTSHGFKWAYNEDYYK